MKIGKMLIGLFLIIFGILFPLIPVLDEAAGFMIFIDGLTEENLSRYIQK